MLHEQRQRIEAEVCDEKDLTNDNAREFEELMDRFGYLYKRLKTLRRRFKKTNSRKNPMKKGGQEKRKNLTKRGSTPRYVKYEKIEDTAPTTRPKPTLIFRD